MEVLDHLFEPFATFGKARGTGPGLAIARKIVEDQGGTITAVSVAGQGATFAIRMPALAEASSAS